MPDVPCESQDGAVLEAAEEALTMSQLTRACLAASAIAGLALSWLMFDVLGDPWDYCDYPEECLGTFFPRALSLTFALWVSALLLAALALVGCLLNGWKRRDVAAVAVAGVALGLALGITPLHFGTQPMAAATIESNRFLWDSDDYRVLAAVVLASALTFAVQALRFPVPERPSQAAHVGSELKE